MPLPAPAPALSRRLPMSSSQQHPHPQNLPLSPLPRRTSSRGARLHLPAHQTEPPIPPRLVGSPLLNNLRKPKAQGQMQMQTHPELWIDGDEFGTHRARAQQEGAQRYTSPPPPPAGKTQFGVPAYPSSRSVPA